ncbi:MAG: fasciclin domain-containing protein [Paludibacter sp.]|nr:fasciclin domain-containing protein [Paludibacter sp.]
MNNNKKVKYFFFLPLLTVSLLMTGCYESTWETHVSNDVYSKYNLSEVIAKKPELSTFYKILKKTGYDQFLTSANSFTVFAPKNDAWATIDTTNLAQLVKIVSTLIVYKSYFTDMPDLYKSLKSIKGKNIFYDPATRTFNGASIDTTANNFNLRASNGVIHETDKVVELRNNIWEYLSTKTTNNQYKYINSLNLKTMDLTKSIAIGVYPDGRAKYDTVWTNVNNFLKSYPIDNEDSLYTYVVLENDGFDALSLKYKPFFQMVTSVKTDSATHFNVCQDFVFKGNMDITKFDTLTNVDGVKVPLKNIVIKESYITSNGRVYIVNAINIPLKNKIKPIKIEGENFTRASDVNYVFTRYKLWASGERDIAMASGETQTIDTLVRRTTGLRDSIISKTYFLNSNLVANTANFFIEYKARVNSANYDVYYVAYDDNAGDVDLNYRYGYYRLVQKLFIAMPGGLPLIKGITDNTAGVANNYLGEGRCFVGQGRAGVNELTKLKQMNLVATTQLVDFTNPITTANSDIMTVTNTGTLTMWLCNSAQSIAASRQGLLFLDYILLVPRITQE